MSDEADHTRRWLLNAGGAAIFSGAIHTSAASAQTAPVSTMAAPTDAAEASV